MKLGVPHSCGDSRLSCVDCQGQVCPSCMEQCPVGNRCKKCAERFTSHVVKVPPMVMVRTGAAAAVLGLIFGYFQSALWGGFYSWLILYAIGFAAGKVIHKIAGHKLGKKVVATILGGLLIGAMLSPARGILLGQNSMTTESEVVHSMVSLYEDPGFLAYAAKQARQHYPEFEKAFNESTPKQKEDFGFRVKAPFVDGELVEHLWLRVAKIEGDKISGQISVEPKMLESIKINDETTVDSKNIDDFAYSDAAKKPYGDFGVFSVTDYAQQDQSELGKYNYNPYRTSSCWMTLLILAFGVISPVLAVKIRN